MRNKSLVTLLTSAAIAAHLLAPPAARAGGGTIPEIGVRETAMGAVVGRPDELSAVYHNPAGLTLMQGTNLFVNAGVSILDLSLKLRPWDGTDRYIKQPVGADGYFPEFAPSMAFGVIPMLVASTNLWSKDLVAAVGIYFPNAVGAAFDEQSVARFHAIESYIVAGAFTVALAYRPIPQLSVGAGFNLVYVKYQAQRRLFPVINKIDVGFLFKGNTNIEFNGDDVTAGATLGLLWQPLDFISVGLSMISRVNVALEGDVIITPGADAMTDEVLSGTHRTEMFLPWTIQAGLHMDLTSYLELGLEWRYYIYRGLDDQRSKIEGIPLLSELVSPKNYYDSVRLSGGFCVRPPHPLLKGLELMIGMHYDEPPAPDNTMAMDQPTFYHIGLHSGVRYRLTERLSMALTYIHYWYLERSTDESVTSPPANYQASGDNHIFTVALEWRVGRGLGLDR